MTETLLATQGTDAERRELCGRSGRRCSWNWSDPVLVGAPGRTYLTQEAWCQTCGRERSMTVSMRGSVTDLAPEAC